jgi:hypothetical protein
MSNHLHRCPSSNFALGNLECDVQRIIEHTARIIDISIHSTEADPTSVDAGRQAGNVCSNSYVMRLDIGWILRYQILYVRGVSAFVCHNKWKRAAAMERDSGSRSRNRWS